MKKDSIAYGALFLLGQFGEGMLDAFFPAKYPYAALWRPLLGLDRAKRLRKETVAATLWRLKQEGLVERIGAKKIARWRLTSKGTVRLKYESSLQTKQPPVSDGIVRLVIFDIPESGRRKRDVVREQLIGYGFRQLQKSVWIGDCPLPEEFITLIDELELGGNVHIFSIREYGTIKRLKKESDNGKKKNTI